MVGIKFQGRLGNQLFQYAFIRAASLKLKTIFFIYYPIDHKILLHKYFSLGSPFRLLFAQFIGRIIYTLNIRLFNHVEIPLNTDQPEMNTMKDMTIYNGYFQTSYYFEAFDQKIFFDLQIRKKYKSKFLKKYSSVFTKEKIAVIHFRRSDYEKFYIEDLNDTDFRLPLTYYQNCLHLIQSIKNYKVIVVGDHEEIDLGLLNLKVLVEKNDFIVDFQLLQNADILILSNSTFAWWAATLNPKQNKMVYAPKNWIGFKQGVEFPKGIMSPQWTWVDADIKN